jgi:hypothetical protein
MAWPKQLAGSRGELWRGAHVKRGMRLAKLGVFALFASGCTINVVNEPPAAIPPRAAAPAFEVAATPAQPAPVATVGATPRAPRRARDAAAPPRSAVLTASATGGQPSAPSIGPTPRSSLGVRPTKAAPSARPASAAAEKRERVRRYADTTPEPRAELELKPNERSAHLAKAQ